MRVTIILTVVRRTITLPEDLDRRIRASAEAGESFSAAVARLAERGLGPGALPSYAGVADGPADDDSLRVEELLGEILDRLEAEERGG